MERSEALRVVLADLAAVGVAVVAPCAGNVGDTRARVVVTASLRRSGANANGYRRIVGTNGRAVEFGLDMPRPSCEGLLRGRVGSACGVDGDACKLIH